jgi:hypothetical protein
VDFAPDIGDDLDSAKDIGTIRRGRSYNHSGDVGRRDEDWFELTLDRTSQLSVRLENKSDGDQPIAMTLLDSQGRSVRKSGQFSFKNVEAERTETLSVSGLEAGNYFVRLTSRRGKDEDYEIDISASDSSSGSSSGSLGGTVNIGPLRLGETYRGSGSVGRGVRDLFEFSVDDRSRILAELENDGNEPIAFTLLDSSGNAFRKRNGSRLFVNVDEDDDAELRVPNLPAGTYYLRAQSRFGDDERYSFELTRADVSVSPV